MIFYQPLDGYSYNSDTLILYDFIKSFKPRGRVLEVGSGCGILGLLLLRDFNFILDMLDKQEIFSFLSLKNAQVNGLNATVYNEDFIYFKPKYSYDFLISNPPYYDTGAKEGDNICLNIARNAKYLDIYNFVKNVKFSLNRNGKFIFCYDSKQILKILSVLAKFSFNLEYLRLVHYKEERESSLMLICAGLNSKLQTKVLKPFIAYKNGLISEELKRIYEDSDSYSIKCSI